MRVVVTGANGFIGQNLRLHLEDQGVSDVVRVTRETSAEQRRLSLATADAVVHLAGVNRPTDPGEFVTGNSELTQDICNELLTVGRPVPVVLASSIQAALDNPYGRSKAAAEDAVMHYSEASGAGVAILRLANVFGKWSRPNYNSAVSTFCHNLARGLPVSISDPTTELRLVHVDDVVSAIAALLRTGVKTHGRVDVGPVHDVTLGDLVQMIRECAMNRQTNTIPRVGTGLVRALYATYVSYIPVADFSYSLRQHADERGVFAEMLRTTDSGQFSFFTAHPGVTRGGHYHHSKTEKFLVVKGSARFGFRHIVTGERCDLTVHGGDVRVVETVPGWVHDITNVGDDEMFVMLWANENFDPVRPDTVAARVDA